MQRPQRPLQQAADDAARHQVPTGLGLDSAAVRQRMVGRLREGGIADERVLAAFAQVERHRFVDSALVNQAYEETSLPIGLAQTISKPSVVALMLQELLRGRGDEHADRRASAPLGRVLEIGTGCGYQAALLACLAREVVSIERLSPLVHKARANLAAAGVQRVQVHHADGRHGYAALAPYDTIVSAAGGDDLPPAWLAQLALAGRLAAPVATGSAGMQELVIVDRQASGFSRRQAAAVYFVPLKSGAE